MLRVCASLFVNKGTRPHRTAIESYVNSIAESE